MSDLQERVREWDEYFTINCHLPAAAIRDLFDALSQKDAEIERLRGDIQVLKLQRDAAHISRCPRCAKLEAALEAVKGFCKYCGATYPHRSGEGRCNHCAAAQEDHDECC